VKISGSVQIICISEWLALSSFNTESKPRVYQETPISTSSVTVSTFTNVRTNQISFSLTSQDVVEKRNILLLPRIQPYFDFIYIDRIDRTVFPRQRVLRTDSKENTTPLLFSGPFHGNGLDQRTFTSLLVRCHSNGPKRTDPKENASAAEQQPSAAKQHTYILTHSHSLSYVYTSRNTRRCSGFGKKLRNSRN
jgi:hypothetical protein